MRAFLSTVGSLSALLFLTTQCEDSSGACADGACAADTTSGPIKDLPATLDLGTADCGSAASKSFSFTNTGKAAVTFTIAVSDPAFVVTPANGTVPPGSSAAILVTATVPAAPGTSKSANATVSLEGQLPVSIALTASASGTVLKASASALEFGFAPIATALKQSVTVTNEGNVAASVTPTIGAGPFSVAPANATIAPNGSATFEVTYQPTALGVQTTSLVIATERGCATPLSVALSAGDGAWPTIENVTVEDACAGETTGTGALSVKNVGTKPLEISNCVETSTTDVDPTFAPAAITVQPGATSPLAFTWSKPAALHSGTTASTVRCHTNAAVQPDREVTVQRKLNGADLVLAPVSDLSFKCDSDPKSARVRNTGNVGVTIGVQGGQLPFLLGAEFGNELVEPAGAVDVSIYVASGGSGINCQGLSEPQTGTFEVYVTEPADLCSITPSSLPVTLTP